MRVNWGGGGDYGRDMGVSNSAAAARGTNNSSNNHIKSDGSSGDMKRAIPIASAVIMAAAAALSGMSSRSQSRPRGEGWTKFEYASQC